MCIEHTRANKQSCPSCNTKEYTNIFNRKQHGQLLKLRIRCTNNQKGCEWVGELGDQERHLTDECLYEEATASETNMKEEEIEIPPGKVEASKQEIVQTFTNDLTMLAEIATEEECAEMLTILEESYDKYEAERREMLNEFKMLRKKAERLKQLIEEETRKFRKLDTKRTRNYVEIQAQLQANNLYNSRRILQLKQQLLQMKGNVLNT